MTRPDMSEDEVHALLEAMGPWLPGSSELMKLRHALLGCRAEIERLGRALELARALLEETQAELATDRQRLFDATERLRDLRAAASEVMRRGVWASVFDNGAWADNPLAKLARELRR